MAVHLHEFVEAMEAIAPPRFAEPWDNVGLLVAPSSPRRVGRALLTIDLTEAVLAEAIDGGAHCIVAYHPPIFSPLKRVTAAETKSRIVLRAIEKRIAIHTPHTALDAAPGGVNDWLADGLGAAARRPIQPHRALPASETHKLITFVPRDAVDAVRAAMADAGAGAIGDYTQCSFNLDGEGTFLGGESTNPAVGERGRLEREPETKLEMVSGAAALATAIEALRAAHPYEEPPIEVHALQPRPSADTGAGRIVAFDPPITVRTLVERTKKLLGLDQLQLAMPDGMAMTATIGEIALCPGAGGSLFEDLACPAYLTGEMRHHDVLAKTAAGSVVILTDHTHTERGYLPLLRQRLDERLGHKVAIEVSARDHDPLTIV